MIVLSVLFVACWSSGFIGAKLGGAQAPVTTVLLWRFLPLALLLIPVAVRAGGPRSLGRTVVVGLLSQTGYLTTVYWAVDLGVNTGTTALIDGVQPLVAAALVGPLLGVVVTARQWAGLVLGLAGVVLVTASDAVAAADVRWWAYPIPLLGMLALIAATVVQRRITTPPPMITSLAVHCGASATIFTVAALLTGTATPPASPGFWLATAWLIVFATLGGYGLYWYLLANLGVTRVNSLMFLMAPTTAVWGALMFGESFTPVTAAGLAIGTAAVVVVNASAGRPERSRSRAPSPPPGDGPQHVDAAEDGDDHGTVESRCHRMPRAEFAHRPGDQRQIRREGEGRERGQAHCRAGHENHAVDADGPAFVRRQVAAGVVGRPAPRGHGPP